jgi:hypothetical protein
MRLLVRLSLVGLVGLVAIGFAVNQWLQTDSNPADSPKSSVVVVDGQCESEGVSLVVDFGSESELQAIEKCISNYTDTSWNIFEAAGLSVTGTSKYPVGFVCRIEDFPAESKEPCRDMPDTSVGSWSYFVAAAGASDWQYSTWGAATHKPACGTAEAWLFKLPSEDLEEPPLNKPKTSVCSTN